MGREGTREGRESKRNVKGREGEKGEKEGKKERGWEDSLDLIPQKIFLATPLVKSSFTGKRQQEDQRWKWVIL